jgi:predicted type IV restriction endonuclease
LEQTLPKAWNKIIEETDDLLIDLINETAEKICGFKADTELVERFLSKNKDALLISTTSAKPSLPIRRRVSSSSQSSIQTVSGGYTRKSISSFYFRGSKYDVRSWKDLLIKLCEIFNATHKNDFDKTLNIVGKKRPYFTRNKNELRAPQKVNDTNIYVETNLSANRIVKICSDMLAVFGYTDNDLKIDAN